MSEIINHGVSEKIYPLIRLARAGRNDTMIRSLNKPKTR